VVVLQEEGMTSGVTSVMVYQALVMQLEEQKGLGAVAEVATSVVVGCSVALFAVYKETVMEAGEP
jgi:hypothetical protein